MFPPSCPSRSHHSSNQTISTLQGPSSFSGRGWQVSRRRPDRKSRFRANSLNGVFETVRMRCKLSLVTLTSTILFVDLVPNPTSQKNHGYDRLWVNQLFFSAYSHWKWLHWRSGRIGSFWAISLDFEDVEDLEAPYPQWYIRALGKRKCSVAMHPFLPSLSILAQWYSQRVLHSTTISLPGSIRMNWTNRARRKNEGSVKRLSEALDGYQL